MKSILSIEKQIEIAQSAIINIEPSLEVETAQIGMTEKGYVLMQYNPQMFEGERLVQVKQHETLHYLSGHLLQNFAKSVIELSKAIKFTKVDFIATPELINVVLDHSINIEVKKMNNEYLLEDGILLLDSKGQEVEGTDAQILSQILSLFEIEHEKQVKELGSWKNPIWIDMYFNKKIFDEGLKIPFNPPEEDGEDGENNDDGGEGKEPDEGNIDTDNVSIGKIKNPKNPRDRDRDRDSESETIKKSLEEIQENLEEIQKTLQGNGSCELPGSFKGGMNIKFNLQDELEIDLEDFLTSGFNNFNQEIRVTEVRKTRMGFFSKKQGKSAKINLIADVSGSVVWNKERMKTLGSALSGINKTFNLSFFDVGMSSDSISLTLPSEIEDEITTVGGGGTQLLPAVELYQEEELLSNFPTIIITDGELFGSDLEDSLEILRESEMPFRFIILNESESLLSEIKKVIGEDNTLTFKI